LAASGHGLRVSPVGSFRGKIFGRRRFDALGYQLLQTPQLAVVNPHTFKVTYSAVEIVGHGTPRTARDRNRVGDLFQRQPADIASAVPVNHKGDRVERSVLASNIHSTRRMSGRLGAHLTTKEPAEIGLDSIRRQATDRALALPATVERQHETGFAV
jgi:hypothetical protein